MLDADIAFRQGGFALDAHVTIPSDRITALFGPSGAGKTSLLLALAGLRPLQGRVALNGKVCADSSADIFIPAHRRGFGLVFQDARLFPHLSVGQNLAYAHRRAPVARFSIEEVAEFFDIAGLLDRPVGNLSGGEKARVALARALVASPEFLLLDEPFAALDGARRRAFISVLLAAQRRYGIPMLVVTHSIDDTAALASHLVALKQGKLVAQGPLSDVTRRVDFQALLDPRDTGAVLPAAALASSRAEEANGLWLRADHVILAAAPPLMLSARNILEGVVRDIAPEADGSRLVTLESRVGAILARLTAEAVQELNLAPGKPAWAVFKAHAV
jgi:molybdate transport system ATP-binding protein